MTTTVAQLIAHLQTLPQDATVEITHQIKGYYPDDYDTEWVDFDIAKTEVQTFEHRYDRGGDWDGKTVVFIGEH